MQLHAQAPRQPSALPLTSSESRLGRTASVIRYHDPLEEDSPSDPLVVMSERQLIRLLFVASDTAARFQRDAIDHDPLAWMFAPRDLFVGEAAVEACRDREAFVRSTLLHGLGLGLDADAEMIDRLLEDDEADVIDLVAVEIEETARTSAPA